MVAFIKKLFSRQEIIQVDLKGMSLDEIMINFVSVENKKHGGIFIEERCNENHIVLSQESNRKYFRSKHIFEYIPNEKILKLNSRYEKTALLLYLYLLMPLPILFSKNINDLLPKIIIIEILMFLFFSIILIGGIKSESREFEREVVLRINYKLRENNNHGSHNKQK